MVDHSPCHIKIKCLSPGITTGTSRKKKCICVLARSNGRVEEPLPCHPKVNVPSTATVAGTIGEEMAKMCNTLDQWL